MPARQSAAAGSVAARRYFSFVVRLAPGSNVAPEGLFRGRVRHVQSGNEAHFLGFAELEAFMQSTLAGESGGGSDRDAAPSN